MEITSKQTLVVGVKNRLSAAEIEKLRAEIMTNAPGVPVLILDGVDHLLVLDRDETAVKAGSE